MSSSTSRSNSGKPKTLEASPQVGLRNVLRLVEDDTAALHSLRGNCSGLRRFSEILIGWKSALRLNHGVPV